MKSRLLILIPVGWFFVNLGWAAPPFPVPARGGLPACEEDLATCEATAQAFPATGQTSCWFVDGTEFVEDIDCVNAASAGQDGDIRAGKALSYKDNGLTITDKNTKLEWMKQDDNDLLDPFACDRLPGSLDKDCVFTWDEAFEFVAELNTDPCFAGRCDWRVPNVRELRSIVNYGPSPFPAPAVSEEFHDTDGEGACLPGCAVTSCSCTNVQLTPYWSSTSFDDDPSADSVDKLEALLPWNMKDRIAPLKTKQKAA